MGNDKPTKRRKDSTSSESSVDSAEDERKRDLKERDEFADRLRKKDESHTRKVVEVSDKRGFEEAAKRLKLETEDRDNIMPHLRIQSRRKYLEKRKEDKVAELEADILDDEYLFDEKMWVISCCCLLEFITNFIEIEFSAFSLTDREKKEREHKKQLLQIAREHEKARELGRVQRYRMPQDMKKGEKEDYYEVDERENKPNSEQLKWESEQLASAVYKFGAKDASRKQQEEYDLLLEDQIEFIQAMTMDDAKKDKKREPRVSEQERKRMDLKETKESLPVFPFRDDLIAAIREHQVSFWYFNWKAKMVSTLKIYPSNRF